MLITSGLNKIILKMSIKSMLIEFIVRKNLIPIKTRWRKSVSGVGRLFNDVYHMLKPEDRRKLAILLYEWGLNDAEEVVKTLRIKRDLHGCALAILAVNSVFGIRSKIVREGRDEVVIHATKCLWKDKKNWTPEVCATIDQYDIGLVAGINKSIRYYCLKRRSRGDPVCEVVLKSAGEESFG
jgi:hypothetical protein